MNDKKHFEKPHLILFKLKIWDKEKDNFIELDRYHGMDFIPQIGMEVHFDWDTEPMWMSLIVEHVEWYDSLNHISVKVTDQQYHNDDWDRVIDYYKDVRRNMTFFPGDVSRHTRWKVQRGIPKR